MILLQVSTFYCFCSHLISLSADLKYVPQKVSALGEDGIAS